MSRLRNTSSSSLRHRKFGALGIPNSDASRLSVCQPRQSAFSNKKPQDINIAHRKDRIYRVFLAAVDDDLDTGDHIMYSGPPLLFDIDASQPDLSSLELAARMTLMFADEVHFSTLTYYGLRPIWNHNSLRRSALTFLRAWDVQYRCDVLPWVGWFSTSRKEECEEFLALIRALYVGSTDFQGGEGDENWTCFSRRKGVLRVDLTARFVYRRPEDNK
ncbi:hypothetical protein VM1G_11347 [Cytospora mali]|uniref:Uncharacterized protein n=1 Tax=Cytospora mali TaxID=578113 RepID=A0A194VMU9_CYTMA|nr:hypothetical protein VM1G_11347 [Valsa mali]